MAKFSLSERAMLANQFRILSLLQPNEAESYDEKAEIFESGYSGLYSEALSNIDTDEISDEICTETHDILTMFRYIKNAKERLSAAELAGLDLPKIKFEGFDGNNDPHYHFAIFMIEKQKKYEEHDPNGLNSHSMTSMIKYRKMLPVYKEILDAMIYDFSAPELQRLIDAVNRH
ncbi:MAG TPA: YfbU family protein [Ferruginibacter sp.]|nr:YfbU family protein [Ferruginibacter sp.]